MGKKLKVIPFDFTPDTTAFAGGDALYGQTTSPIAVSDVFDTDNGNGKVVSFSVQHSHGSTLTKKGISAYLFSQAPSSTPVAINAAENITAGDEGKVCGRLSVVAADFVDSVFAASFLTRAHKTNDTSTLPIIYNDSSSDKKSLWIKLIADEAQTYSSVGKLKIEIIIECY